jgi:hypothetical protein
MDPGVVAWSKFVGADTAAETTGESPGYGEAQRGANAIALNSVAEDPCFS